MRHSPRPTRILLLLLGVLGIVDTFSASNLSLALDAQEVARQEDEAAALAFRSSVRQLEHLENKAKNPSEKARLALDLVESFSELARVEFRLSSPTYRTTLRKIIDLTSELIQSQAREAQQKLPRLYYLQAMSLKEAGETDRSIEQFKSLLTRFPNAEERASAHFLLYDLLDQKKDYRIALEYLFKLNPHPSSPYYTSYLDKIAFSYFYLDDIPKALQFLQSELAAQRRRGADQKGSETEKAFKNWALFYFTGGQKTQLYAPARFIEKLSQLQPGIYFFPTVKYYSSLLRSGGQYSQFEGVKNQLLSRPFSEETLSFLLLALEKEMGLKEYDLVADTATQVSNVWRSLKNDHLSEAFASDYVSKVMALTESPQMQSRPQAQVNGALLALYSLQAQLSNSSEARQKAYFNTAEISMKGKAYDKAALSYLRAWQTSDESPASKALASKAQLGAVHARYLQLVAQDIVARSLLSKKLSQSAARPLPQNALEWMDWVKTLSAREQADVSGFYQFEVCRLLYHFGYMKEALLGLKDFAVKNRDSKHYSSAVSLIMDTYLASEAWEEVSRLAYGYLGQLRESEQDLKKAMRAVAEEAKFRTIEAKYKEQKYQEVLNEIPKVIQTFPQGKRYSDFLSLAGSASSELKDNAQANQWFAMLVKSKPNTEMAGAYYLTSASAKENAFDYAGSLQDNLKLLELPAQQRRLTESDLSLLRRKVLHTAWILDDQGRALQQVLERSAVCTPQNAVECQKYAVLLRIQNSAGKYKSPVSVRGEAAQIDSVASLDRSAPMNDSRRVTLLNSALESWFRLSQGVQFALLPKFQNGIKSQMNQIRSECRSKRLNRLSMEILKARVEKIAQFESLFSKVIELPWKEIQFFTWFTWSGIYFDLSQELSRIPGLTTEVRQELITPFQSKALDLGMKAFDLGTNAGVDSAGFSQLVFMFTNGLISPDEYKKLLKLKGSKSSTMQTRAIQEQDLLVALSRTVRFNSSSLQKVILDSVRSRNRQAIYAVIEVCKSKKWINSEDEAKLTAVFLMLSGAHSEGLLELASHFKSFEKQGKEVASSILALAFYAVWNSKKTSDYLEKFASSADESNWMKYLYGTNASALLGAINWTESNDLESFKPQLIRLVQARRPGVK